MTRPTDTWRVCDQPVTVPNDLDAKGRGCTCNGYELFNDKIFLDALARLADHATPAGNAEGAPGVTPVDERRAQLP